MGSVLYTSFNGMIVSEDRDGVERDYVHDAIGSTLALLNSSQTQTDTWSYWPYGETASRTGSSVTPFQFNGAGGLYADSAARSCAQAQFYSRAYGLWIVPQFRPKTDDRLNQYQYSNSNPVTQGFSPGPIGSLQQAQKPGLPGLLTKYCLKTKQAQDALLKKLKDPKCDQAIQNACGESGLGALNDPTIVPRWIFPPPGEACKDPNDPKSKPLGGVCGTTVTRTGPTPAPGDPCKVNFICISRILCQHASEGGVCGIIWELGNACECKNKGFQRGEKAAQALAKACGCSKFVWPGGQTIK